MKKIKTLLAASLISTALTACGDNTQSNSTNEQRSVSQSTNQVQQNSYEWNWLANVESMGVIEETIYTKNYYFVLDGSGSMDASCGSENGLKIDVAKNAISQFVQSIPQEANIGLLAFDSNGTDERVPLGVGNRNEFNQELQAVNANSGTPLRTAITRAYNNIQLQAATQAGHGEYNIIVVTDGEASGGEDPSRIVEKIAQNSPVNLYTIGFCIGSGHSLNNEDYVHYYTANNAATIISGLQEVLAESEETFDSVDSNQL